ncbi:MAG: hypothetical protein HY579_00230, partial [Nitrospinae bacterium]|nr:hypothetical protein [Nitrospinota bacterium]
RGISQLLLPSMTLAGQKPGGDAAMTLRDRRNTVPASAPGKRPEVTGHAQTALNDACSPSGSSPLDPTSTLAGGGIGSQAQLGPYGE